MFEECVECDNQCVITIRIQELNSMPLLNVTVDSKMHSHFSLFNITEVCSRVK